jgi:hypothetical protein
MAGVEVMRIFMGFCSHTDGIDRFFCRRRQSLSMMRRTVAKSISLFSVG